MPVVRGAVVGALTVCALLVRRWLRKPQRIEAKKTTTLELDPSDLQPVGPPQPPNSRRNPAMSVHTNGASLAPPDVHSFELH
jgi:hypothetical protein